MGTCVLCSTLYCSCVIGWRFWCGLVVDVFLFKSVDLRLVIAVEHEDGPEGIQGAPLQTRH